MKKMKIAALLFGLLTVVCLFVPGIMIVDKKTEGEQVEVKRQYISPINVVTGFLVDDKNPEAVQKTYDSKNKGKIFAMEMKIFGEDREQSSKEIGSVLILFITITVITSVFLAFVLFLQLFKTNKKLFNYINGFNMYLAIANVIAAAATFVLSFFWVDGFSSGDISTSIKSFPFVGIMLPLMFALIALILVYYARERKVED